MAKVGRKPVPTKLKILKGTDQPCRINPDEPQPVVAIPEPPPEWGESNPIALTEWERITPHLHELGLLTEIDRAVLVGYCEAWSRLRSAEAEIAKCGLLVEGFSGSMVQNPAVSIANTSFKNMLSAASEFGLTPSSRTRVAAAGGKRTENPFSQLKHG